MAKLLLFAFLVAVVPITTYFTTIKHIFDGELRVATCGSCKNTKLLRHVSKGNTTYAAIAAIISANIIMVAYVIVALNEDAGSVSVKKTQ